MSSARTRLFSPAMRIFSLAISALLASHALAAGDATVPAWKQEHLRALNENSRILQTRLGPVEYAVEGEGTAFMSIHGTPGGYDIALTDRHSMPLEEQKSFKTLTLSRPGYLRTPLASGETFEQQADLFAALLDELKIDRVVAVASSGGGYAGLQFALRHPNRCIALVMLAPATGTESLPKGPPEADNAAFERQDEQVHAFSQNIDPAMFKDYDVNDPRQVALMKGVLMSMIPASARFAGRRNDLVQRAAPAVDRWPVEKIAVPTLIIHGTADKNSEYQRSVALAAKIPNAKLITMEGADHYFPITRALDVRKYIDEFVGAARPQRKRP